MLLSWGDGYLDTSDREHAALSFKAALARHPTDVDILPRCIVIMIGQGKIAEAAEYSDRAVALDPGHIGLLIQHAGLMQALGLNGRALDDYDQAIAAFPERSDFYDARAVVLDHLDRAADAESDRAKSRRIVAAASAAG